MEVTVVSGSDSNQSSVSNMTLYYHSVSCRPSHKTVIAPNGGEYGKREKPKQYVDIHGNTGTKCHNIKLPEKWSINTYKLKYTE